MTRTQAKFYAVGRLALIAGRFAFSGHAVPNFWLWMLLPAILIGGGIVRLLRK